MRIKDPEIEHLKRPKGWVTTTPLANYSSLNELSLFDLLGCPIPWLKKHVLIQFSFNLHTPLELHPKAFLTFHTRDADTAPSANGCCFEIANFNRWRLNVSAYKTSDDFLASMKRWNRNNYDKSKCKFAAYGCEIACLETDWSQYAEAAYQLYANVASRHGDWLYDRHFFQHIAKRADYKFLGCWHKDELVAFFVLQEELPTLHWVCCGFDYVHSSACYAYSWMSYALIKHAIAARKYENVDAGLTADAAKRTIGFTPVPACMDIYASSGWARGALRLAARYLLATITPDSRMEFTLRR